MSSAMYPLIIQPNEEAMVSKKGDKADLLRELERQGFEVRQGRNLHFKIYRDGHMIYVLAHSGGKGRGDANALAALRRAGFVWKNR